MLSLVASLPTPSLSVAAVGFLMVCIFGLVIVFRKPDVH